MPDQTGLQQAIDNTGNPYPAVRVRAVQVIAANSGATTNAAPFLPQTKVVRVCSAVDMQVSLTGSIGSTLISAGFYQDFIVWPGDVMGVRGDTADGNVSLAELM